MYVLFNAIFCFAVLISFMCTISYHYLFISRFIYSLLLYFHRQQCRGCEVDGGGVVVVGVEQDRRGGGFKPNQVSHALVTALNLWPYALPHHYLVRLSQCYNETHTPRYLSAEESDVAVDRSGDSAVEGDGIGKGDEVMNRKIISWGHTPFAVVGGALLIPFLSL